MDNYLTHLYRTYFKYVNSQQEIQARLSALQTKESEELLRVEFRYADEVIRDLAITIQKYLELNYTKN